MLRRSFCDVLKILHPKSLYSTSTSETLKKPNPLVTKLTTEFGNIPGIISALRHKELNNVHFEEWKSRIHVLRKYHFNDEECFKMICAYPYLLKVPLISFETSVKQWYMADLGINNFQFLLETQPQLIDIDVNDIRKRLPQLRVYFKSREALCHLIAGSPNVMFDDLEAVLEKLDYIVKERKFNMGDVIESKALSKSFHFIKFRFELLEKCGIYKQDNSPAHKKNKFDKTKHINPPLAAILDPNGLFFTKIAKISQEEYSVCKSLFAEQEIEEEYEEDEEGGYEKK